MSTLLSRLEMDLIGGHRSPLYREIATLKEHHDQLVIERAAMLSAMKAVVGTGYCKNRHPASQDFVSKEAIALVRAVITRATK